MVIDSPGVCGLFFYLKFERQFVTFSTANLRFSYIAFGFFTKRGYLYLALKERKNGTTDDSPQLHILTGIGAGNIWYRTSLA
jgi:hypothetical protein